MVKHSLNGIVIRALDALQVELLEMDLEYLDTNELITDFTCSFQFDKQQNCVWYWHIEEFIDNAYYKEIIDDNQYENILMKLHLGIET